MPRFMPQEISQKIISIVLDQIIPNPKISVDQKNKTVSFFGIHTLCFDVQKQNGGALYSDTFKLNQELDVLLGVRLDDLLLYKENAGIFHSLDFAHALNHHNEDHVAIVKKCLERLDQKDEELMKGIFGDNYLKPHMIRDVALMISYNESNYLRHINGIQAIRNSVVEWMDFDFVKFLLESTNVSFWRSSYNARTNLSLFDYLALLPLRDNLYRLKSEYPNALAFALLVLLNHVGEFNHAFKAIRNYDDFILGEYLVGNKVDTFPSGMIDHHSFVQLTNAKSWSWILKQEKSTINKLISLYLPKEPNLTYHGFSRFRETIAVLSCNKFLLSIAGINKLLDLCIEASINVDRLFADISSFTLNDKEIYDAISMNSFSEKVLQEYIVNLIKLDGWYQIKQRNLMDVIRENYGYPYLKNKVVKLAKKKQSSLERLN